MEPQPEEASQSQQRDGDEIRYRLALPEALRNRFIAKPDRVRLELLSTKPESEQGEANTKAPDEPATSTTRHSIR